MKKKRRKKIRFLANLTYDVINAVIKIKKYRNLKLAHAFFGLIMEDSRTIFRRDRQTGRQADNEKNVVVWYKKFSSLTP